MRRDEKRGTRDQELIAVDTENVEENVVNNARKGDNSQVHRCPSCPCSMALGAARSGTLLGWRRRRVGERLITLQKRTSHWRNH